MTRRRIVLVLAVACVAALFIAPRARATIEEQRARLPPAAECGEDTVTGVWRSHQFHPRWSEWSSFTLEIRRTEGSTNALEGTITARFWQGNSTSAEPPPCGSLNPWDIVVSMDARGTAEPDGRIVFGGVGQWRTDRVICGNPPSGYNLDRFSGVIDPARLEFQSVNNDGGRAVNEPTLFRRIRCPPMQSAIAPSVNPVPPAFYPDQSEAGCLGMMR